MSKNSFSSEAEVKSFLDKLYDFCLEGIPKVSRPISELASDYLNKYQNSSIAAKAMIKNQVLKCTTTGAVTGLGGIITLPAAVTADVGSVLYVQMRMIACTAYMAGYDINSDQVQTIVYACLAGVAVNELVKKVGVQFGQKLAINIIDKIPGKALIKINQKVGFRFLTKFGQKGLINLGKLVPGIGALVSGGFDYAETKVIGRRAYKWFFENDFTIDNDPSTPDYVLSEDEINEFINKD
jgi:hypothetical protein